MRFYIIEDSEGNVGGCETTVTAARDVAAQYGDDARVYWIDVPVSADTVRRLLGNLGGYATAQQIN